MEGRRGGEEEKEEEIKREKVRDRWWREGKRKTENNK